MRKIKIYAIVSMDGFISREDGDIDWILEQDNSLNTDYGMKHFSESVDTVLMNRNHYTLLNCYDLCSSYKNKTGLYCAGCLPLISISQKIVRNYQRIFPALPIFAL